MANEAVTVAKKERKQATTAGTFTLSTGVEARVVPVSQSIIQDAMAMLKEPEVPLVYIKEKEREEPNPAHPDYLKAMEQYRREQFRVTFDTFALFGVELVAGVPEDDGWLKKLRLHERLGHLDLTRFDLDDEIDREFVYKRYVAMSTEDYVLVGMLSGINPEEVDRAVASFRGEEARPADPDA